MSDWKPDREEAEFIGRCMAIDHGIAEIVTDQLRRGVPLRNVRATLEDALRITRMVRGQTTPPEGAREERVMEKHEAEAEAAKREAHKARSLTHKVWKAAHSPQKGWHVALVDNYSTIADIARRRARDALLRGDGPAFLAAASDALLASCRATLDNHELPND